MFLFAAVGPGAETFCGYFESRGSYGFFGIKSQIGVGIQIHILSGGYPGTGSKLK